MSSIGKTIHVLALGLWFGMAMFFTFVVGLSLFGTMQSRAELAKADRPAWLPLGTLFDQDPDSWQKASRAAGKELDNPLFKTDRELRREQGTRVAGTAVSPMFDVYFLLQGACGLLALITSLGWSRTLHAGRVHRLRTLVLLLALLTVLAGWPIERTVSGLRHERNQKVDTVLAAGLSSGAPPQEMLTQAANAAKDFALWHVISLFLNFGTVIAVTVAMGLAAHLPHREENVAPAN